MHKYLRTEIYLDQLQLVLVTWLVRIQCHYVDTIWPPRLRRFLQLCALAEQTEVIISLYDCDNTIICVRRNWLLAAKIIAYYHIILYHNTSSEFNINK